jgi:hypothetical protein
MVCMPCGLRQPVSGACARCGEAMARYYCSICHLFDDEPGRSIYHCPFCNVCRRGQGLGVDFFHCMQCNACMSLSLFNQHTCRERAMEVGGGGERLVASIPAVLFSGALCVSALAELGPLAFGRGGVCRTAQLTA